MNTSTKRTNIVQNIYYDYQRPVARYIEQHRGNFILQNYYKRKKYDKSYDMLLANLQM